MADLSVTIDDLLREPEPVRILTGKQRKDKKGNLSDEVVVVYLKKPTETEKGICIGAANRARRELRAKLADPSTEEHANLLLEPLQDSDPETLRNIWVSGKLLERALDVQQRSLEERDYVPEPEGDIILPADQDAYDATVEKVESKRERSLAETLSSITKQLQREADELGVNDLLQAALPAHTETLVQREWSEEFSAQLVARCTFADSKRQKPYFKTVEQARALREQYPKVFKTISDSHNGLMIAAEPSLGF